MTNIININNSNIIVIWCRNNTFLIKTKINDSNNNNNNNNNNNSNNINKSNMILKYYITQS